MIFNRYKKNLKIEDGFIVSYSTKVAELNEIRKEVHVLGWWSRTTSKHINYAAKELGYQVIQPTKDGEAV